MLHRDVVRWGPITALAAAATVAIAVGAPSRRVAIRVACDDPGACELARDLAADVWSEDTGPDLPLDVVVTERELAPLALAGVPWQILVPDIDAAAAAEAARLAAHRIARPADWFAEYQDFEAIGDHLKQLATLAPDRARLETIGHSIEGRPIWALRIGAARADATPMIVNGTQHAREWISSMVTTCVADRLIRDYDREPAVRAFVDRTTLWVVPVVNPDGYTYSWQRDRYWRKNRRGRFGVDLNRNFSVAWGGRGSSGSERSQGYRGTEPFSEPESRALRDLALREHPAFSIDFHAYGQLVLYPWGYTHERTKDDAMFAAAGERIGSAIAATHQTSYRVISSSKLYLAAGTAEDWFYGEAGATSFTIELRPRGGSGFVLPPEQIRPTCDEGLAAVLALRDARD